MRHMHIPILYLIDYVLILLFSGIPVRVKKQILERGMELQRFQEEVPLLKQEMLQFLRFYNETIDNLKEGISLKGTYIHTFSERKGDRF